MELTREEAIKEYREHWNWMEWNPSKCKSDSPNLAGKHILHDCFLCHFTAEGTLDQECKNCPIDWPVTYSAGMFPCTKSYYGDWENATAPGERSRLAAIIRDLPEKKIEPAPDFKIGDWVKVVYAGYGFSEGNTYIPESQRPNLPYKSPFDGESYEIIAISTKPDKWYGFIYLLKSKENTICCMHYKYMNNTNEPVGFELTTPPPRFAVGDKVVPVSKSIHCSLEECVAWNNAKRKGQSFLYVALIDHDGDICCHENYPKTSMAYNFKESDLIPYVEPEKKPEPKAMFKVGDRVRVKDSHWKQGELNGKCGIICDFNSNEFMAGIDFGEDVQGHDCNGKCKPHHGFNIEIVSLELASLTNHCPEPKTITENGATFIFRDNVTVCIIEIDGHKFKGIAKCRPEDTWDETIGKGWAGTRALRQVIETTEAQLKKL